MSESKQTLTRYLLGELSEVEQAALEERFFDDPRVFNEVTDAESALVDDYARNRLAPDARRRFEQFYLAHPRRRERARFAEALAGKLDRLDGRLAATRARPLDTLTGWRKWVDSLGGPRAALAYGLALMVVSSGLWFVMERAGVGRDPRPRAPEVQGSQPTPPIAPPPQEPQVPPFVTFALNVGTGVRTADTGPLPVLLIPRGISEVRLELSLREHDYPSYRALLSEVGGAEILRRGDLTPTVTKSGATLSLTLPAALLRTGDYMLTLQGSARAGEFEDLSQSLFRVDKR